MLTGFGAEAQEKFFAAKVLVIGAGGLGCPALQYLSAAGTGTIGIVDYDNIELTNLQRQTLFSVADIGRPKAHVAAEKLQAFNPDVHFRVHQVRLAPNNAADIINDYDLVIDGTDNFATRYMVNDACVLLGKPLIYGAVLRFEGQTGVFNMKDLKTGETTNYRDLFPKPPAPETVPSCTEAGVLGVLPGMIGTMQATEAIKIITGIGEPLINKIISYNALQNLFYEFSISPLKTGSYSMPKTLEEFKAFDYDWFCGVADHSHEISVADFDILRTTGDLTIIDVREPGEEPKVTDISYHQIPLSTFDNTLPTINPNGVIVIFCKSGKRSLIAANKMLQAYQDCRVYSLAGGVEAWLARLETPHHSSQRFQYHDHH